MAEVLVGTHDPMVFAGPAPLGVWVECECGWISPGSHFTSAGALALHGRHIATAAPTEEIER